MERQGGVLGARRDDAALSGSREITVRRNIGTIRGKPTLGGPIKRVAPVHIHHAYSLSRHGTGVEHVVFDVSIRGPASPVALGLHCPLAGRIRTHKYRALCSGIGKANDPRWRPAARPAAVAEMIEVNRGTRENEIRGAIANDDAKGAGSHSNLRI